MLAKTNAVKKKKRKKVGRGSVKNESEWTGNVRERKKFLAVGEACVAIC